MTSLSLFTFMHWRRKWQPTPVFLPGESQGWEAWWTALYGVAQSWTRLKRLSSSSEKSILGLIFTVVSKLLLLYSTIDKTSMLKMNSFSTLRVTQRGSQRYMEKRRGRRDLEDEASQIMSFSFLAILKSFLS